ncbi:hypothetical protein TNIN_266251 [Trichonephila inaurata madagascariensis]|uniref:Uncharacterized protein n=1 Tax=Trichonephila inaurata madagascariensis TaxID=2747483 RepID=A0A8X6M8P2_9ARAC|nr:hypothetical protein TNIN_266251 [Trichonephila inaurata madagascariensis]
MSGLTTSMTFLDTGKYQHDRCPDTHGTTHGGQPGTSRALCGVQNSSPDPPQKLKNALLEEWSAIPRI